MTRFSSSINIFKLIHLLHIAPVTPVNECIVNYGAELAIVLYDPGKTNVTAIQKAETIAHEVGITRVLAEVRPIKINFFDIRLTNILLI